MTSCDQTPRPFDPLIAWHEFEQTMSANYAYADTSKVDVSALFSHYEIEAQQIAEKAEFIDLIQVVTRFFIDPHLNAGPLNEFDYSVIPTGSDIWAGLKGNNYVIEDIKRESSAAQTNLSIGDKITTIDGKSIDEIVQEVFANTTFPLSSEHKLWAVNIALGGLRNAPRKIEVQNKLGQYVSYTLESSYLAIDALETEAAVSAKRIGTLGYIRINNSLGNEQTVDEFTAQISALGDTKALIIDLRNTPSGGNTSIAEPILGHFVSENTPYQLYQTQREGVAYHESEMQRAYVTPRKPHYSKPYVVLVGRWTGSMGEGMAIGFDAIGARAIIGAPMADLLGGISSFDLAYTGANIEIAFQRMFHVDGTYREDFVPTVMKIPADTAIDGSDPVIDIAIKLLSNNSR